MYSEIPLLTLVPHLHIQVALTLFNYTEPLHIFMNYDEYRQYSLPVDPVDIGALPSNF